MKAINEIGTETNNSVAEQKTVASINIILSQSWAKPSVTSRSLKISFLYFLPKYGVFTNLDRYWITWIPPIFNNESVPLIFFFSIDLILILILIIFTFLKNRKIIFIDMANGITRIQFNWFNFLSDFCYFDIFFAFVIISYIVFILVFVYYITLASLFVFAYKHNIDIWHSLFKSNTCEHNTILLTKSSNVSTHYVTSHVDIKWMKQRAR